jgi:hypothetical protein
MGTNVTTGELQRPEIDSGVTHEVIIPFSV